MSVYAMSVYAVTRHMNRECIFVLACEHHNRHRLQTKIFKMSIHAKLVSPLTTHEYMYVHKIERKKEQCAEDYPGAVTNATINQFRHKSCTKMGRLHT